MIIRECIWSAHLMPPTWRANTRPSSETHARSPRGTVWPPREASVLRETGQRRHGPRARPWRLSTGLGARDLGDSGSPDNSWALPFPFHSFLLPQKQTKWKDRLKDSLNTLCRSLPVPSRQKPVPWREALWRENSAAGSDHLWRTQSPKETDCTHSILHGRQGFWRGMSVSWLSWKFSLTQTDLYAQQQ